MGLLPDRTLVLTLDANDSLARTTKRDGTDKDRMGSRDTEYYQKVTSSFETFARNDSNRFRLIDATGTEVEVTDRLMAALSDLL